MKPSKFIDLENKSEYHLDINELYKNGIELIQKYSSDKWTDFNEHDPGVTILENLVFAITDVCYRLGFDVFDFLVNEEGVLDLNEQALYPAERILTTHPVTINDIRKVIFDRLGVVSNVWLEKDNEGLQGLYRIALFAKPQIHFLSDNKVYWEDLKNKIKDDLIRIWPSIRNLGEDISENGITVLSSQTIYIRCSLTIDNSSTLETILARVIYTIDNYFNPELTTNSLAYLKHKEVPIEDIFEGPLLQNGFVDNESISAERPIKIHKGLIVSLISQIDGVIQIEDLQLLESINEKPASQAKEIISVAPGHIPRFSFEQDEPDTVESQQQLIKKTETTYLLVKLRPRNNAQYFDINYDRMIKILREMQALNGHAYAVNLEAESEQIRLKGNYKRFDSYHSIQNDLPHIYATNQFGLSKYDSKARKAEVLQLKSYLILFEQLLQNFTSQIQHLKDIYSPNELDKTYFSKPLTDAAIKDVLDLYQLNENIKDEDHLADVLETVLEKVSKAHPHIDRKSRLLDYMLAIYGEHFSQGSLRRISGADSEEENLKHIVGNKAQMLKNLQHFNRNSAKAPTNTENPSEQSGFAQKIAILLGLDYSAPFEQLSISNLIRTDDLSLVVVSSKNMQREPYRTWENSIKINLKHSTESGSGLTDFTKPSEEELAEHSLEFMNVFIGHHYLPVNLLREGSMIANYRLFKREKEVVLAVLIDKKRNQWYMIDRFSEVKNAIVAGYKLASLLAKYNRLGERFRIVDHILLRPGDKVGEDAAIPAEFYGLTCSIVFPSWPLKFSDQYFQRLACETAIFNMPSHIAIQVHWLDFDEFEHFEWLYAKWLKNPEKSKEPLAQYLFKLTEETNL